MDKASLECLYRTHHEQRGRYGYLYCHGARGPYLKRWIGEGKRVLDLGCRDGMLTSFFASKNEVVGVDIDQKALSLAKERLGIATCWVDLNFEWPFAPASFDAIVACEIAEHLFFLSPFLEKVATTLKEGGLFLGSVPNAFRLRNRLRFLFGREYETDPTHVRQFSWEKLTRVLEERFTEIQIVPLQGKVAPFIPVSPHLPIAMQRLFAKDLLWRSSVRFR